MPDPSSRRPSSTAGGGPYAPRPRRLARAPRCGQGGGAQPRGSRTPASIGRAHASHQPAGFATCDCARLPSTRRSSMGGRGGGGRARTPARVTRRLRRGSTPCRTDAARLVVAGEVLHVRRLLPVGRMTGAVAELVLLAVAVAAEVLGAVAARRLVLSVGRRELVLARLDWLSSRSLVRRWRRLAARSLQRAKSASSFSRRRAAAGRRARSLRVSFSAFFSSSICSSSLCRLSASYLSIYLSI